jgi:hypothetical protein
MGLGANLKCFHHTREEVVGVLEAEAGRANGVNGGAEDYSTSRTFRRDEIEEMIIRIDATLLERGISVVDTPDWTSQPDDAALDEALANVIDYARDRAREKDVQSLSAVARLRGMRRVDRFEKTPAIFVTTNASLARGSSAFFKTIEGRGAIPVCVTAHTMTRVAWVKKPLSAPDLPKHMISAASYASLNPPPALWREYLSAINSRREKGNLTDDEYHVLRSSLEARRALMDETFGGEEAFSAGTLDEVLAHARAAIQAEARAETAAERDQRLAAEAAARSERERRTAIESAHRSRIDRRAARTATVVGWAIASVITIAVIVGALATIPGFPLLEIKSLPLRLAIWVCFAAFFVLSAIPALTTGFSVLDIRRAVTNKVEDRRREIGHRKLDELHAGASSEN